MDEILNQEQIGAEEIKRMQQLKERQELLDEAAPHYKGKRHETRPPFEVLGVIWSPKEDAELRRLVISGKRKPKEFEPWFQSPKRTADGIRWQLDLLRKREPWLFTGDPAPDGSAPAKPVHPQLSLPLEDHGQASP